MRSYWISTKAHFGNALQQIWYDAIDFGLGDKSKTSLKMFSGIQLNLGYDTIWKCLRKSSVGCILVSANTQNGNVLQKLWYVAIEVELGDSLKSS